MILPQPKTRQLGMKVLIGPWQAVYGSKKRSVDETEIVFSPEDAGKWFYVQLAYFKDLDDLGYHVSSGAPGVGPVVSQETNQIRFLATICSGTVNSSGTGFSEFYVAKVQTELLEES